MGNHSMNARNIFGQPKPGADQLTVLDIQWRSLVQRSTDCGLGPNWNIVYLGNGAGGIGATVGWSPQAWAAP